jgi:hypothetical protein
MVALSRKLNTQGSHKVFTTLDIPEVQSTRDTEKQFALLERTQKDLQHLSVATICSLQNVPIAHFMPRFFQHLRFIEATALMIHVQSLSTLATFILNTCSFT